MPQAVSKGPLNYRSRVDAGQTADECVSLLRARKVKAIAIAYDDDGHPEGITWRMGTPTGMRQYTLPVDVPRTLKVLQAADIAGQSKTMEQARRTAWRVAKDWLVVQFAFIDAGGGTLAQVMLPYMHVAPGGVTAWDAYLGGQLAIEAGDE